MPYYIKPKFTLTSNSEVSTTDPGPSSLALSLSTTPNADTSGRLTVGNFKHGTLTTSTTPTELFAIGTGFTGGVTGHDLMSEYNSTDVWSPGTDGCFLYLKNQDTSGTDSIYIGIVSGHNPAGSSDSITGSDSPTAPHASTAGHLADTANTTLRTMTLKPGEFAWFPWDYTGRIFVENNAGDPILEWWLFDRN